MKSSFSDKWKDNPNSFSGFWRGNIKNEKQ